MYRFTRKNDENRCKKKKKKEILIGLSNLANSISKKTSIDSIPRVTKLSKYIFVEILTNERICTIQSIPFLEIFQKDKNRFKHLFFLIFFFLNLFLVKGDSKENSVSLWSQCNEENDRTIEVYKICKDFNKIFPFIDLLFLRSLVIIGSNYYIFLTRDELIRPLRKKI